MGKAIDFHAVRHRLKLVHDDGSTSVWENRDDVSCPVCGEPFAEALATAKRTYDLSPASPRDVCVVREDDRLVVLTHARE